MNCLLMVGLLVSCCAAQSKLTVTVADSSFAPVTDLGAASFSVADKTTHPVSAAVYKPGPADVMVMVETSAFTNSQRSDIERMAILLFDQMSGKDRMALVGFADTVETMQEFTSNKQALVTAVKGLRFTSTVNLADSINQTLERGFGNPTARKVLVVVSSGQEGVGRGQKNELVEVAAKQQVAVYALSLSGKATLLEELTKETAGFILSGRDLRSFDQVAKNLFAAFHGGYELTVEGAELAGRVSVDVKGKDRVRVSYRREE